MNNSTNRFNVAFWPWFCFTDTRLGVLLNVIVMILFACISGYVRICRRYFEASFE